MTDIKDTAKRSLNMKAIRSKNTKPEIILRKELFKKGIRYRKNVKYILGHPDIYLKKYNTAIFVHGCFWHQHPNCKYAYIPKSNIDFWEKKFFNNTQRDLKIKELLNMSRIKTLIVWECSLKKMFRTQECKERFIADILDFLFSDDLFKEI